MENLGDMGIIPQDIFERKSYTDEEIRESQREKIEKIKTERFLNSTGRIRITAGGKQTDFTELKAAMSCVEKSIITFAYAGVHVVHPELFWINGEAPNIQPILDKIQ